MALSIGELSGYLSLDDSKFEAGLVKSKSSFGKVGDWLKSHGKEIGMAAGAAVGAALAVGLVKNMEFEAGRAKLRAQLGLSEQDAAKAGKVAGLLYSGDFADSMDQANEAIRGVVQNMNMSVNDVNFEEISSKVLTVANTFDQDLGGTTAAVGQMMKTGLAKDATEALDLITVAMQGGVDKSGDLLETINEYSTTFRDAGISGADAMSLMSQGLQAGARDADTVADALKEFAIRAQDGSKASAEGYKAIGLNAKEMTAAVAEGGPKAREALDQVLDGLNNMKDPAERNAAAVALFGTKAEDLGDALFALDLDTPAIGLDKVAGATEKVADITGSTTQSKIDKLKAKMELWTASLVDLPGPLGMAAAGTAAFGGQVLGALGPMASMLIALKAGKAAKMADTAATNVGTLAHGRTAVASAASAVAHGVATGATKAMTVAQRALNVVLRANPIGIVITLLAALAAAVVVAYNRSETFRRIVDGAFRAVGAAGRWLWNEVLQPVFRFLVSGFATVMDMYSKMLGALSKVPGFGWAGRAADAMGRAADKARGLADNINQIPSSKVVTVTIAQQYTTTGQRVGGLGTGIIAGARAAGGPVDRFQRYLVGERGPEILTMGATSGYVTPNHRLKAYDTGGLASGSGLMVKGPAPERVLSPRQTEAFERAMDSMGDSGDLLEEVRGLRADNAALRRDVRHLAHDFENVRRTR